MGFLRVYLAICVIFAHCPSSLPWDSYSGREAVQIFFIISGFYMQFILGQGKYRSIRDFYKSRILRIFLPYYACLSIVLFSTAIAYLAVGEWLTLSATISREDNGSLGGVLATLTNGTILFQDWTLFFEHDAGEPLRYTANFWESKAPLWHFLWIPQAWSVGLELTFYLVAPFLARFSTRRLLTIAAISISVRLYCYFQLDLLHGPWHYRFFPFELAHFCYGMLAARVLVAYPNLLTQITNLGDNLSKRLGAYFPFVFFSVSTVVFIGHSFVTHLFQYYADGQYVAGRELYFLFSLFSWILIIPVLFSFSRNLKIDRWIGELSYPVYLLHFTIMLLIKGLFMLTGINASLIGIACTVVTITSACLLQIFLLQPMERWRQSLVFKSQQHQRTM